MNIINSEIETRRKEARTSTPPCNRAFERGYLAGATRQPTEEEIKAACLAIMPYVISQPSQQVFDFLTKATGAYPGQEIVQKVIGAMRGKATEE